uniref:Dynamin stalk domain-containing protein n=1 Tax=Astyanax mexicanus TaxID=7994 RepID=A0A3B1KK73_ASTMX
IVHSCLNKIANTHFEAYSNLLRAAKEPIEDLHEEEYEKAKEKIKSQFRMERLVYSQDGLYSWKLESVKNKPEPKRNGFAYAMSADVRQMAQHLSAYFMVCPLLSIFLMFFCLFVHLSTLKLIEEDSGVARRRKTACERMDRLRKARQVLAISDGGNCSIVPASADNWKRIQS